MRLKKGNVVKLFYEEDDELPSRDVDYIVYITKVYNKKRFKGIVLSNTYEFESNECTLRYYNNNKKGQERMFWDYNKIKLISNNLDEYMVGQL